MPETRKANDQPQLAHAQPVDPAPLPDVATQPHPTAASTPPAGDTLQQALPEVAEAAQKVGGYKRLAEIAETLDHASQ